MKYRRSVLRNVCASIGLCLCFFLLDVYAEETVSDVSLHEEVGLDDQVSDIPEIMLQVTAIVASHESDAIDPLLTFVSDEMKTLFTYTSYMAVKTYTVLLAEGQSDRIGFSNQSDLVISCIDIKDEATYALNVAMGNSLHTDFTISAGGHIVIGGPPYQEGTLLLLIEARQ